jgi:hypothetical protein
VDPIVRDPLGVEIRSDCSVPGVPARLYAVKSERGMMPLEMTSQRSLEPSALGDLYVRHAPEGIRLAFLLTGDRTLAEGLVQEAFARLLRVWTRWPALARRELER